MSVQNNNILNFETANPLNDKIIILNIEISFKTIIMLICHSDVYEHNTLSSSPMGFIGLVKVGGHSGRKVLGKTS